jgi:AIPR protein
MSKYSMLVNILDQIRAEGASTPFTSKYVSSTSDPEQINHERSRAFIHLYLKVSFGMLDFAERERLITDGSNDGGIDGYFIDTERRMIFFVQSKFRTTEANFTNKQITLEELLAMDVTRILEGHEEDESGNKYSGKILQLQRDVRSIEDIGRYKYKIVILANIEAPSPSKLSRIVGGLPCEVVDYDRCYELLVFPVISGTYFNASELVIHLDLSNKNAGSKISYTVDTRYGECDITALFVPTLEIAKIFHKYKNSILKFNPRSYLELEGAKVNEAIRNTVLHQGKNEFALYNNGITMLSAETNLNERIGQKNKAQLNVTNPQIINGGQTAYTLSRIYEEQAPEQADAVFEGKEVLLKVITLNSGPKAKEEDKVRLIEAISTATNQQTAVINADRYSNETVNLKLQKTLFDRYGLLFERKRGEFEDGVYNAYVQRSQIIERNLFFRILFAANGDINRAVQKRLFAKLSKSGWSVPTSEQLDRFYFGYLCSQLLAPREAFSDYQTKEIYGKVFVMTSWYMPPEIGDFESAARNSLEAFLSEWDRFVNLHESSNTQFIKVRIDRATQKPVSFFNRHRWVRSGNFPKDVKEYFEKIKPR